jgi:hypothetical protein
MDGDPWIVGDAFGQRRAFVPDEVDVHAARGERVSVILHAGTPTEVPDNDDGGAHWDWIGG